ncbi:ABC transporter permease [Georgenia yuyongxinii]|uniref:ABC transporter permease n=1 Tax=Georgenia yuyongxinii TaxID=2589797 RepID=A0A5B8C0J1_9MICO|nr:ABC transporter permease [Georgenia yuyongxinii]QDC24044.1 ABC transporter permease [Georgenia yuyongxinii]
MTGVVGALVEAWDELRLHKLRVLLSLVGIAVSVAAMTAVLAVGEMTAQAQVEMMDRDSGRQTTITVNAWGATGTEEVVPTMRAMVDRYDVTHASVVLWTTGRFRAGATTIDAPLQLVDQPYGVMHRVPVSEGAWFSPGDDERRAPALVVNESFLAAMGGVDLAGRPVVTVPGDHPATMVVIGVMPDRWEGEGATAFALYDAYTRVTGAPELDPMMGAVPQLELWVPPELAEDADRRVRADLTGALGEGAMVDVYRNDQFGQQAFNDTFRLVVVGIGALVLLLGALSLVNIALVTVRQRIREIGIRRSFGASSGRVFFSIMLESVVATAVAGVVGVGLAITIVQALPLETWLGFTIEDVPPFPLSAALTGLLAAAGVGALAGLLPAVVAVRVRPIDAIRY